MELRHLRYFVAVAERQNVTRAAEDLHMAQQPLSVAIKQLETEIGYDLFERIAGRIRLTAAGVAFAGEARAILAATDRAVERGRRAAHGEIGVLRVTYCSAAMAEILPRAIAVARERYPDLVLEMRRMDKPDQLAALKAGDIDLALVYRPFDAPGWRTHDVLSETIVAAVPAAHPFARNAAIEPRDLAREALIRFAGVSMETFRNATDEVFAASGVAPQYVAEIADVETALGLAAAGIGLTLVSELTALVQRRPGLRFVPVVSEVRARLAAVWHDDAAAESPVRRFVDLIVASAPAVTDALTAAAS